MSLATHKAHSEGSDQSSYLSLRWAHRSFCDKSTSPICMERRVHEGLKLLVPAINYTFLLSSQKLKHEKGYNEKDVAALVTHVMNKEMPHSRLWYRRNAIKNMTGAPKLDPKLDDHTKEVNWTMKSTVM